MTAINIGVILQSNGDRWGIGGSLGGEDLTANLVLRIWNRSVTEFVYMENIANGHITLGNDLIDQTSRQVRIINSAVSSSSVLQKADTGSGYWLDSTAGQPYDLFKQDVTDALGELKLDGVILVGGENEAIELTVTQNEMEVGLTSLISNIRSDFTTPSGGVVPIVISRLVGITAVADSFQVPIRDAQVAVGNTLSLVATTVDNTDLALADSLHLTPAAYITHAERNLATLNTVADFSEEKVMEIGLSLTKAIDEGYVDDTGGGAGSGAQASPTVTENYRSDDNIFRTFTASAGDTVETVSAYGGSFSGTRFAMVGISKISTGELLADSVHEFGFTGSLLSQFDHTFPAPIELEGGEDYGFVIVASGSQPLIGSAFTVSGFTSDTDTSDVSGELNATFATDGTINKDLMIWFPVIALADNFQSSNRKAFRDSLQKNQSPNYKTRGGQGNQSGSGVKHRSPLIKIR